MNARALIAAVAALVMLLPVAAAANNGQGGQPIYQVSGGGQFDVPLTGPGSTIAFTAQLIDEETGRSRGQLQVIERDGPGPGDRFHGVVDCVIPDFVFDDDNGGVEGARFGGHERGDASNRFIVDVVDNGQPNDGDNDLVFFNRSPDPDEPCENGDELPQFELGRGNVKIHDRR